MKQKEGMKMKIGIIRCMQTEDYCPGTTDFKMIRERKGAFEGVTEEITVIGFINCGGCPAKKAVLRARELVRRGSRYDRFCLVHSEGNPDRLPVSLCKKDEGSDTKDLGEDIRFIDYTH